MARTFIRFATVAALTAATLVTPGLVASASPGLGTFTHVTTPSKTLHYRYTVGKPNTLRVAGTTSLDVTAVAIVCVTYVFNGPASLQTMASDVPVTAGSFSTEATFRSTPQPQCRLIAMPDGVDPETDYLGSFTGPTVYEEAFGLESNSDRVAFSYSAIAAEGDGAAVLTDVGSCGTEILVTIELPQLQAGGLMLSCLFSLPATNISPSGSPTRSTIEIDGHSAYLPSGVNGFLLEDHSLSVKQSALTVTRAIAHNGDQTFTESAPLMACSSSDAYPPTESSCPSLALTGVRYQRVSTVERSAHQVKVRDSFTSTDHRAHSVSLQYQATIQNETGSNTATGSIGYTFPGHGGTFRPATLGEHVSGLGEKAGTMLIRSDVHATPTERAADTMAGSWSRPPSTLTFSATTPNDFQLEYSLKATATRPGVIGFAISERPMTAQVKPLAAAGLADFVTKPTITSPHHGARLHGAATTVKGSLTAGANGLPTSVLVNGHKAKITAAGATHATYKVTFRESPGKHTIKVVASDTVGNSGTAKTTVTNA